MIFALTWPRDPCQCILLFCPCSTLPHGAGNDQPSSEAGKTRRTRPGFAAKSPILSLHMLQALHPRRALPALASVSRLCPPCSQARNLFLRPLQLRRSIRRCFCGSLESLQHSVIGLSRHFLVALQRRRNGPAVVDSVINSGQPSRNNKKPSPVQKACSSIYRHGNEKPTRTLHWQLSDALPLLVTDRSFSCNGSRLWGDGKLLSATSWMELFC